jgi:hypothetical protein
MSFTAPLGLLALLAVPAVVLLHLFRRRLHERRVAAVHLFVGDRLVVDAGRTRTRLWHTPSLWLECLAALVLAAWLAGLSFGGARARHVVFVLDDSASMQAGGRDRAAAAVRASAQALAAADRMTLLCTGPRPAVLAGPVTPAAAVAALATWQPVQRRHDPGPALELARELAGGDGEIRFCTDTPPTAAWPGITVAAFGTPAANCALLTAQRVPRADGGEELQVRIGGFGAVAATELSVTVDDRALAASAVTLVDGIADVAVPLPAGAGTVRLDLRRDALPVDDTAWLLPAPERTVAVCDLLPAELGQQLELARVLAAIGGVRGEPDPRAAELVLTVAPGALRPGQTEVVLATDANGARDAWRGPFVVDRLHPWLAGVALHGVVWCARRQALPGQVLVAAGAQALLSEEVPDSGRRLWLNLDAGAGNLVRAPDWPVLWANVVERARLEAPGLAHSDVLLGEEVQYRRPQRAGVADADLVVEAPDGARSPVRGGRLLGFVPTQAGVHRLLDAGGAAVARVAARFCDPAESDLRELGSGTWPPAVARPRGDAAGGVRDGDVERRWLALLLLALLLADWWWLGRGTP